MVKNKENKMKQEEVMRKGEEEEKVITFNISKNSNQFCYYLYYV